MSRRDIERALEKALGQFVLSKSAVSDITEHLTHEYEAFRTRDLSGYDSASLLIDAVYEPLRRWGSMTGLQHFTRQPSESVLAGYITLKASSYPSLLASSL
jgi:transposase-like protein